MSSPRILIAATGGTIASSPTGSGLNEVRSGVADLLAAIPEAEALATFELVDVCRLPSHSITPMHMCLLAQVIAKAHCDGVVVTHGTDTIEETAYALGVMLDRQVPVALTGAMRPPQLTGADGPANMLAAIRVATTPPAAALGPVVVMHEEVHLARYVTKVHTGRVAAFSSPGLGPVGSVIEGRVRLSVGDAFEDRLGLPATLQRRVDLVWTYAGADRSLIDAASGAEGLVVAGTGGGHVPDSMLGALVSVREKGVPVVVASRTGAGPTLQKSYGGPGSESDLRRMGVMFAGSLSPLKARLRLQIALELGVPLAVAFQD